MSHATFYAGGTAILKEDGTVFPMSERPVVRWREKVSFEIRLPNNASFPAGYYRYAFDYDRDFLNTHPCNAGECTLTEGKLTFDVVFNSLRQAEATNGRRKPIPFYIQISTLEDDFSEYIIDDTIWVAGCVWDGRAAPAEPATDYYTKEELDRLIEGKVDSPTEAGQTGYVLGLAEDGSTAWIPQSGGGGSWGSITGDLSEQTDLADALNGKANLVGGKVPSGELPAMDYIPTSEKGAANGVATLDSNALVPVANLPVPEWGNVASGNAKGAVLLDKNTSTSGLTIVNGFLKLRTPADTMINNRNGNYPVVLSTLDYAVRSVSPNVTTIPAATTAYSLLDASATTNNHSFTYLHKPASAPTYTLPAVTNTAISHLIRLTVDFTDVQALSFVDGNGDPLTMQYTPTLAAGDVYTFVCEYSAAQSKWLIYPVREGGSATNDFVLKSEVGAANGVAGLDANGKVLSSEIPIAKSNVIGGGKLGGAIGTDANGVFYLVDSTDSQIASRMRGRSVNLDILNKSVTAALSDTNHLTMTSVQQATAQSVLGAAPEGLHGSGAPTTSTAGKLLQQYLDDDTQKTYTCTKITNTGTEQEPVYSYTWTNNINAKGGELVGSITQSGNGSVSIVLGAYNSNVVTSNKIGCAVFGSGTDFRSGYGNGVSLLGYSLVVAPYNLYGQVVVGKQNIGLLDATFIAGVGTSDSDRLNGLEVRTNGVVYCRRGVQQAVFSIPSATSAYTLSEGFFLHTPLTAPVYTLPSIPLEIVADKITWKHNPSTDGTGYYGWLSGTTNRYTASTTPSVGDNTYTNTALSSGAKAITAIDERTHECILTIRFSSSVLTYAFEDSAGNPITPLPLAGTIADGSVVAFRCTWEALLNRWVIMPVMLGSVATSVPQTLTVSGTGATSNSLDGTYTLTNDTNNSRPVWYNSTNQKYLFAVENGMDAGWYAWVVGGSVVQQSAGDTMMFYTYCTYDVQGLASLSETPDQSTTPWYSMGSEVQASEFSVTA